MKRNFFFLIVFMMFFFHLCGLGSVVYNDSINVSLSGKYPMGRMTNIAFYGNYAYVISGNGVLILDISDSLNIEEVSAVCLKDDEYTYISKVEVVDTLMYLLVNARSMYILNISDPYNPYIVSQWEMPDFGEDFLMNFTVYDNYIYAVSFDGNLYVVNTTDLNSPVCVNEYDLTEGNIFGVVEIIDGYLVCVNSYIWVYDLADPSSPSLVNKIVDDFRGEVSGIKHYGDYWIVVAEYAVSCYKGTLPDDIVSVGEFTSFPDDYSVKDVYMIDDSAITVFYEYDYEKTRIVRYPFDIFDSTATVTDTVIVVLKDTTFMNKYVVKKIETYNGKNYILYSSGMLSDVSIQSLSSNIDYNENFVWGNDVDRLKWYDGKVFVFSYPSVIGVLDTLNGDLSSWHSDMFNIEKNIIGYDFGDSNEVFLWDKDSTYIYKYDGETFYKLFSIPLSRIDSAGSVKRYGDLLYISCDGVLHIYDISDFSNINELSTYDTDFNYMLIKGEYLYGINGDIFEIVDISDPYNMEMVSYVNIYPEKKFCLYGNYAYIMQSSSVSILDVSNPQNIYVVNTIEVDDIVRSIELDTLRNLLYIVEDTIVGVYNVRDVNNPQREGYYAFNYYMSFAFNDICVDDSGVIYMSGRDGIYLLSFEGSNYVDNMIGNYNNFTVCSDKGSIIFNISSIENMVKISLYDLIGRRMAYRETRQNRVVINVDHSGVYYYRIECGKQKETGKIMVN